MVSRSHIIRFTLASAISCVTTTVSSKQNAETVSPTNILFIVMDDVGVDQMRIFGYGGADAPNTPNINAIAMAGVRFRNAWSMPSCTPSRATFFNGRYPLRTHVYNAIASLDLANSQVSPYEATTPKILHQKGYVSALFGKMHLSGSELNPANLPFGTETMRKLGWDRFEGYLDGAPYPIDTTAGGVSPIGGDGKGMYGCGFVPNLADDPQYGADQGACYTADHTCQIISTATTKTPGRTCLEKGGLFDPNESCHSTVPSEINFANQNAHYTGRWIINKEDGTTEIIPASDPRNRGYRTVVEANHAIEWIKQQPLNRPWMASVGFSAIHEPVQIVPGNLLPPNAEDTDGSKCSSLRESRVLAKQMIEGMDHEIGRILIETGLATRQTNGQLDYHPEKTNTTVVITADNGTWMTSVKLPFDPARAKGTPYQTGVWVPMIVAGPMVKQPGREVPHMVNGADLFTLFGELAGIDINQALPKTYQVDSRPMLAYLTKTNQPSMRKTNYTQMGTNLRPANAAQYACLLPTVCTVVFPKQGLCEDQGGIWYGPNGAAGETGLTSCCALNDYLQSQGKPPVDILPFNQVAIRDKQFKLVQFERENCSESGGTATSNEFYAIDEKAPIPTLDRESDNMLDGRSMTLAERSHYQILLRELEKLRQSVIPCEGDGNLDMVVDQNDKKEWEMFSQLNEGRSSWYDFNLDGLTNEADADVIEKNLGKDCQ